MTQGIPRYCLHETLPTEHIHSMMAAVAAQMQCRRIHQRVHAICSLVELYQRHGRRNGRTKRPDTFKMRRRSLTDAYVTPPYKYIWLTGPQVRILQISGRLEEYITAIGEL